MIAALLLVIVFLAVVTLLIGAIISLVRRQRSRAVRRLVITVILIVVYSAALLVVSVTSKATTLAAGTWKCFDEWCATLAPAAPMNDAASGRFVIEVRNKGQRAQVPDAPRAFIITSGHAVSINVPGLTGRVDGGATVMLPVTSQLARSDASAHLLITEGGFPSRLTIGDENSPWHAKQTWHL